MAIVTNRGTSQIRTSNYRKINTKCNYRHVNNINMTMIEIYFVRLSESKHRLLRLYIK
jgi:hypothetical protein